MFLISLIKMMYWISQNTGKRLTLTQLRHCLMRNFGGADDINKIVQRFLGKLTANCLEFEQSSLEFQVSH